jgi:hypothetical protein
MENETPCRRYATLADAEADGWRRVNHSTDRDVSGIGYGGATMFGYAFEAPDGQRSQTVTLSEEKNKVGGPGAFREMFRVD